MDSECANPLLLQWVGEWLETARQHSSKGVTTYKNAYDSLKACPIHFEHPSEAKQLKGLGDKLCARLTDKMTQHCQAVGIPMPPMPHKRKKAQRVTNGDDDGDESDEDPAPKKARKQRPYVPKLRSGAYAIMMALKEIHIDQPRGISKKELIDLAEPHCDSSFTITDPTHGKFYTAWNSMKTLQEKDLVFETGKKGSVRKYGLTDEGWDIVSRMSTTLEPGQQTLDKPSKRKKPSGGRALASRNRDEEDDVESELEPAPQSPLNPYLREDDNFVANQLDLANQQGLEISRPRRPEKRLGSGTSSSRSQANPHPRDDNGYHEVNILGSSVPKSRVSKASEFTHHDDDFHEISSKPQTNSATRTRTELMVAPLNKTANLVSHGNLSDNASFSSFTPIRLPPSSFTISLVLDNREVRSKKDRDYIEEELLKLGIKLLKRSLPVGDALWVAKCHDPNYLSQFGAEGDEVLLDHIVERKRLDDLVSSIMDKRYDEQKFRLSKSGVKNVSYIIEEITLTGEHFDKWEQRVESAIASMQVVNGFFVKKTLNINHTIGYLAKMTRLLKSLYEGKTLLVIPPDIVSPNNYADLRAHLAKTEPSSNYQITYPSFAAISSKSDTLTLRDVFLKMLMCTKGITGEKALEIQKRWKTPYAFVQAFKELGEGKEADKRKRDFLSKTLDHAVSRKKVGKAVSLRIAAVWGDVEEV